MPQIKIRGINENQICEISEKMIDELVDAVRHIIAGGFSPNDISPELLNGSLYHPEIPENLKAAASVSAQERFERAFKTYQESLKQTPSMFESLLADYFEEA